MTHSEAQETRLGRRRYVIEAGRLTGGAVTYISLSVWDAFAPKITRLNIRTAPSAALAAKIEGTVTPWTAEAAVCGSGASKPSLSSREPPGLAPPYHP